MQSKALLIAVFLFAVSASSQTPVKPIQPNGAPKAPNSNRFYKELREDLPAGDGVAVKSLVIEREGGRFRFDQGSFYFYAPVEGHITGAVFVGKGSFDLSVKDAGEQRSLALLTKSAGMTQDFTTLVLRFTDATADEIRKASSGAAGQPDGHATGAAEDLARNYRKDMSDNIELRMLADLIGGGDRGQFFLASFRMGSMLGGRNVLFLVDPEGTFHSSPDQVELTTWSDVELQVWAAYRMQHPAESGGKRAQVTDQVLDISIDRGAMMKGSAESTLKLLRDGIRVVQLNLYPTLRVSAVYSENGTPLDFVQEDKKLDADFGVILPEGLKKGETFRLLTQYAGNDALDAEGNETYYLMPGARDSWYPGGEGGMGDFANYHMTFHIPKNLQIVATGNLVTQTPDAPGFTKVVWETSAPIPVAGFNLGDFKARDEKTPTGFGVSAYASVGNATSMETGVQALPNEVSQGSAAIQIYSDYFGKLPYDHVALTPQPVCDYGQSWPMLVYLPACAFWDSTALNAYGLLDFDASYWKEVTPHEVSHQWWGSLVGFNSYRDQWMSEGFANFSVSIFLMKTSPKMDDYRAFWKEQQTNLIEKNPQGKRPIDVGALTMGGRISNDKNGNVYQMLIYSKGAYVLHMMEMQFWDPREQDEPFKRAMQQFVKDYSGKAATTEDWKASMEKSMPKNMDLRGDGKLDWFFDEFVYGTELPHYTTSSEFTVDADGVTSAHMKITQSNVSNTFVMRVPVYLQLQNGLTKRIFNAVMHGNATIDQTVKLPGKFPSPPKAILVNYNADILTDN